MYFSKKPENLALLTSDISPAIARATLMPFKYIQFYHFIYQVPPVLWMIFDNTCK